MMFHVCVYLMYNLLLNHQRLLKPLHDQFKIKRVVTSTYQSVSGGGKNHMMELEEQTKSVLENTVALKKQTYICTITRIK